MIRGVLAEVLIQFTLSSSKRMTMYFVSQLIHTTTNAAAFETPNKATTQTRHSFDSPVVANSFCGGAMNIFEFTILVAAGSLVAGLLGSLTGLGGGVVLVPLLTLFFKVDIRYAIGASLVSVIATSSGAAAAYVKEGFSNIRIGMFLEIATTLGAVLGAFLAAKVSTSAIAVTFGAVLLYSAYISARARVRTKTDEIPDPLATRLRLNG